MTFEKSRRERFDVRGDVGCGTQRDAASRLTPKTKLQPSAAVAVWRGGAKKRMAIFIIKIHRQSRQKKPRRSRSPKEDKAEPAGKEAAKPRKGRPPKADKAAPGEAQPSKRDKVELLTK